MSTLRPQPNPAAERVESGAGIEGAGEQVESSAWLERAGEQLESRGWMERAEGELAAAGHKRGGARRAVIELLDAQRCALTAVEIEDELRGAKRRVSRASVYRILDELEGLRLVQRVETGQAMVRYERVCDRDEHHHHLVCDGCGLVMPFADEALERAITSLSARVPLAVSEHEIVLRGECRDCAA